jgi:hypothetical protein
MNSKMDGLCQKMPALMSSIVKNKVNVYMTFSKPSEVATKFQQEVLLQLAKHYKNIYTLNVLCKKLILF